MRSLGAILAIVILAAVVGALVRFGKSSETAQTVPMPDRTYNPMAFDTVVWADEATATARGKDVFAWVCAKCHGPTGKGDGGEVVAGDTLHPPSFQDPDWRFARDEKGLYQRIHAGNNRGMPHWGDQGLQPRDIVATSKYILKDLRKDVK